jgi:3-oxoacyl-[acyl-carrier-protein] synthase II
VSNNFAFGGANTSIVWGRAGTRPDLPAPDLDRVVVTGLSALTSAGTDLAALLDAHAEGKTTAAREDGVWVGRVPLDAGQFLGPKDRKRVDRLGLLSVIASKLALEDSGIELTDENRARVGVIVGTGVGPMQSMEEFCGPVLQEGPSAANPAVFPNTVYNAAGGQVAMKVGAIGVASTLTALHGAGASAICYAYDLASCHQADAVIAVAADALTDTVIGAYKSFGVLAGDEPGSPKTRGFALSEAGIGLVLERLSRAEERGARIYGEVTGYGITSDAKGVARWDRNGEGLERAMRLALERAGVEPHEISAIWANAAGLRIADRAERRAIQRVFGDDARVLSPKVQFGEPLGAGGAFNAVLALGGWGKDQQPGPVLVNSMSLGGTNFSLVFAPYGGR